jgi:hypothetical protein
MLKNKDIKHQPAMAYFLPVPIATLAKEPEPGGQWLIPAGNPGIEEGQLLPQLKEKLEPFHRLNLG